MNFTKLYKYCFLGGVRTARLIVTPPLGDKVFRRVSDPGDSAAYYVARQSPLAKAFAVTPNAAFGKIKWAFVGHFRTDKATSSSTSEKCAWSGNREICQAPKLFHNFSRRASHLCHS